MSLQSASWVQVAFTQVREGDFQLETAEYICVDFVALMIAGSQNLCPAGETYRPILLIRHWRAHIEHAIFWVKYCCSQPHKNQLNHVHCKHRHNNRLHLLTTFTFIIGAFISFVYLFEPKSAWQWPITKICSVNSFSSLKKEKFSLGMLSMWLIDRLPFERWLIQKSAPLKPDSLPMWLLKRQSL